MNKAEVKEMLSYPLNPELLLRKKKSIRRVLLESDGTWLDKKIAILGGSTTNEIRDMMELFLLNEGIRPTFYMSEYNKFYEDAMFGNPELDEFQPDVIFIHTTSRNILSWPAITMDEEDVSRLLQNEYDRFEMVWNRLSEKFSCTIIQNNFDRTPYRLLGNKEITDIHGKHNFVFRLNDLLYKYAEAHDNFFVHDIDYLCAAYGMDRWHDEQQWSLYKYALTLKAIPEFSHNVTRIIKSIYGKNKKVLALDLDNTLWGGIVGDDGVDQLQIGHETPVAEDFLAFQEYVKEQKQLGILLAVDSKNEEENAIAGLNHPEGVLRPDDFVCIKANWDPKNMNLETIASELNLGIDSFVFVDDNPAEREIIKGQLPMVSVPDVTTPDRYAFVLDKCGFFEVTGLTKDDVQRSEMYKANLQREQSKKAFVDYNEYLESLEMRATVKTFDDTYIQRIAQLTNKTNQFNLTTRRYSEADIDAIKNDSNYIKLYGRLEDKFGDNGVVSVVFGHKEGDALHVDLWLMSCRVLKRDFEQLMMDCLADDCKEQNLSAIYGYYYPTAKNKMVENMYKDFGFELVSEDNGSTVWKLDLDKYEKINKVIKDINR